MDKFLGLKPQVKKSQISSKEQNKVYDVKKRKRTIQDSWKTEFTWLITEENKTEAVMYCKACRFVYGEKNALRNSLTPSKFTKYSKGSFVSGCRSLRRDGLQDHDHSEGHKDAVKIHAAKTATPVERATLPAAKMLKALNTKNMDRLKNLFTTAHAIVKLSSPITNYVSWCKVDEKKNVDLGETYRNTHSCKEFIVAISEVARADIEAKLSEASFISLMADGSTDVSTVENEIVYIHFCVKGTVHCYFLGMIPCKNGRAHGIHEAILAALKFEKLGTNDVLKKMVSYVGDGAAVNTGQENGVIALFRKQVNPAIVMVKCLSHRVELAFKDALKSSKTIQQVLELLDLLFKFYHKSPKQTAGLQAACNELGVASVAFTRVGGTRWVGHTQTALKNFFKAYRQTVAHLSQVASTSSQSASQSKAKHILGKMKSESVLLSAHFLLDALAPLVKLSMVLQERKACIFQVHQHMKTTIASLNKLVSRPGPEERKMDSCEGLYQGEEIKRATHPPREKEIPAVLEALLRSLQNRFSDMDEGVLEATQLADLSTWPPTKQDATDFGDEHLCRVLDHFKDILEENGVDLSAAESEWTELKEVLYTQFKVHTASWQEINRICGTRVPNILLVMDLLMTLPSGSSECERGFSVMKHTKTLYRNKLSCATMTLLMTVKLHTADISNYNPEAAIHQWMVHKNRRPNFMDRKKPSLRHYVDTFVEGADGGSRETNQESTASDDEDDRSEFSDLDSESEQEEFDDDKENVFNK